MGTRCLSRWAHLYNFSCFFSRSEVTLWSCVCYALQMINITTDPVSRNSLMLCLMVILLKTSQKCVCCWCKTNHQLSYYRWPAPPKWVLSLIWKNRTLVLRFVANILCKQQQPHQDFIFSWATAFPVDNAPFPSWKVYHCAHPFFFQKSHAI